MASTPVATYGENQSFRIERKFVQKWIINDFSCEDVNDEEVLPSTKFEFRYGSDAQFMGKLFLDGKICKERQCQFVLESTNLENWKVHAKLWVDKEPKAIHCFHLNTNSNTAVFDLVNFKGSCLVSEYISNNVFAIMCEIVYVNYMERKTFAELFTTKQDWDVTLIVEGQEFHAHKFILARRSKVFASMFSQTTKEVKPIKFIIANIIIEVYKAMLRYIYTDEVENINKWAAELLHASDVYDLPGLKSMCENKLANTISIGTAAETLILADLHGVQQLMERSVKFIKTNFRAVEKTKGWQKLVNNRHHLLSEIYLDLIETRNGMS